MALTYNWVFNLYLVDRLLGRTAFADTPIYIRLGDVRGRGFG